MQRLDLHLKITAIISVCTMNAKAIKRLSFRLTQLSYSYGFKCLIERWQRSLNKVCDSNFEIFRFFDRYFDFFSFVEKKKIKENRFSMRTDDRFLSPIEVLVRHTTPVLRDIAVATIHSDGTDSSSAITDTSYRNTGDYSNAETASIKSSTSSKCDWSHKISTISQC